jgi:hypothetical protein
VRRATQALVAASVAATAVFAGAAARTTAATGSGDDDANVGAVTEMTSWFDSSDDDTFAPSASAPTNSFAVPSAVSGGS